MVGRACLIALLVAVPTAASAKVGSWFELAAGPSFIAPPDHTRFISGWSASFAWHERDAIAIVGEIDGHYGDEFRLHSVQGGPRVVLRVGPFAFFADIRFGVAFANCSGCVSPQFAAGGGVDLQVVPGLVLRLISVRYLHFEESLMELSAGIAVQLGRQPPRRLPPGDAPAAGVTAPTVPRMSPPASRPASQPASTQSRSELPRRSVEPTP